MKKYIYILCLLLIAPKTISGQSHSRIDSLTQIFNYTTSDSLKLELLLAIIDEYGYENVDTVIDLAIRAHKIALRLNDLERLAMAYEKLARYHTVQSNYKEALRYDIETLRLFRKTNNGRGVVKALNNIGEDYYDLDLFSDAYEYYQESLKKAQEINDRLSVAIATYNLGRVLKSMGQLSKAQDYIEQSMSLSSAIEDHEGLAYSGHDIGEILIMKEQYSLALSKLQEALELSQRLGTTILIPQIMGKIAVAYENLEDFQKSLEYHNLALERYKELNNKSGIAETLIGLGAARMKMGEYAKAGQLFDKALRMSKQLSNYELIIKSYEEMSKLSERQGHYHLALDYYKKFKEMQDSVFSEKQKEQFAQIQIKYETANRDMEIVLLNQKEEQQKNQLEQEALFRNILVVILAFTGVLLATLYRSGIRRKRINKLLLAHQRELEEKSKEMAGLLEMKDKFFSIISHDVRSPIHALMGILEILDGGHLTQEELKQLTKGLKVRLTNTRKLLDNLLDWALVQMNEITLHEEAIDLSKLIDQNITFFRETNDKHIQFFNKVKEGTMVCVDKNMVDLIIRNLVANSVKFTREGGFVEVSAKNNGSDMLQVTVRDNGIGMSDEQVEKLFDSSILYTTKGTASEQGTGLGLKLCKEFVDRLGGEIGVQSKEGQGSSFIFTIKKATS